MCEYTNTCTQTYTHSHTHTHVTHTHEHTCTPILIHTHTHMHTHACTHKHTHTHTHTHTCTHSSQTQPEYSNDYLHVHILYRSCVWSPILLSLPVSTLRTTCISCYWHCLKLCLVAPPSLVGVTDPSYCTLVILSACTQCMLASTYSVRGLE